jgi:hypothetical protein
MNVSERRFEVVAGCHIVTETPCGGLPSDNLSSPLPESVFAVPKFGAFLEVEEWHARCSEIWFERWTTSSRKRPSGCWF